MSVSVDVVNICSILNKFAESRIKNENDKTILIIKKIGGEKTLQAVRISELSWHSRMIRWFGFGGSTLKAVNLFLTAHEPKLFTTSQEFRKIYAGQKNEFDEPTDADKFIVERLAIQKARALNIFKKCVSEHNRTHSKKIYTSFGEQEKQDLGTSNTYNSTFQYSYPNPMGSYPAGDPSEMEVKYKAPIIDPKKFANLSKLQIKQSSQPKISPHVLAFCYEYGLGVDKNRIEAIENYKASVKEGKEYSAYYNLGRLFFEDNNMEDALPLFEAAEELIFNKLLEVKSATIPSKLDDLSTQQQINERNLIMKHLMKDLMKVYSISIDAYTKNNEPHNAIECQKKLDKIKITEFS